jgi:hypothetical protein
VSVLYNGKNLRFETPSLRLPFGANFYNKTSPSKWSVELSLGGAESNPVVAQFIAFLQTLENMGVDQAVANNMAWFKKNLSRETILDNFTPLVKFSVDDKGARKPYPPNFKVTLKPRKKQEFKDENDQLAIFEAKMYNGTEESGDLEPYPLDTLLTSILCKNGYVTSICELTSMWIVQSKFGFTFKMIQGRVDSTGEELMGPAFSVRDPQEVRTFVKKPAQQKQLADADDTGDHSDTGEETIPAFGALTLAPTPAPVPAPAPLVLASEPAHVESEEQVAEPIPVPKKTVVKKVVAKK